jgi:uncharacterized membrane protein
MHFWQVVLLPVYHATTSLSLLAHSSLIWGTSELTIAMIATINAIVPAFFWINSLIFYLLVSFEFLARSLTARIFKYYNLAFPQSQTTILARRVDMFLDK